MQAELHFDVGAKVHDLFSYAFSVSPSSYLMKVSQSVDVAVQWIEDQLLKDNSSTASMLRLQRQFCRSFQTVIDPSDQLYGLWADLHIWMDGFLSSYKVDALTGLRNFIELREIQKGDTLYKAPRLGNFPKGGAWMSEASVEEVPPIIWLLKGRLENLA